MTRQDVMSRFSLRMSWRRRRKFYSALVEDVVMRMRAGSSGWTEAVDHTSVVEEGGTLSGTVMTGEMKLIDLMGGQNLVLIQLEEKLHVSIGDLTEYGEERSSFD